MQPGVGAVPRSEDPPVHSFPRIRKSRLQQPRGRSTRHACRWNAAPPIHTALVTARLAWPVQR